MPGAPEREGRCISRTEAGSEACAGARVCGLRQRSAWARGWLDVEVGVGSGALWAGSLLETWLRPCGSVGEWVCVGPCAARCQRDSRTLQG